MKKLLLVSLLLLSACHPIVPPLVPGIDVIHAPSEENLDKAKDSVEIDKRLIADCGKLTDLPQQPDNNAVLSAKASDVSAYVDCASRHKELATLVRKYWNVK
jgi:hypothetical protein